MQAAASLIREALKEFTRQSKSERTRHILLFLCRGNPLERQFFQTAPDQMRSPAEIDHTARQAFIHWHEGFPVKGISRIETKSVPPYSFLVPKGSSESLTQSKTAIF